MNDDEDYDWKPLLCKDEWSDDEKPDDCPLNEKRAVHDLDKGEVEANDPCNRRFRRKKKDDEQEHY